MKKLSLFGKVNLCIGFLFFIIGVFSLFNDHFNSLTIAFLSLGVSIMISSVFYKKSTCGG